MTVLPRYPNGEVACSPRVNLMDRHYVVACDDHPEFVAVCMSNADVEDVVQAHLRAVENRPGNPGVLHVHGAASLMAQLTDFELQIIDRYTFRLVHRCDWGADFTTDADLDAVLIVALEHGHEVCE